jgi:hypothetical protein
VRGAGSNHVSAKHQHCMRFNTRRWCDGAKPTVSELTEGGVLRDDGPTRGGQVWRVPDTESTRFWSRIGVIQFQLMLQATGVWVQLQTAAYSAGVR